MTTTYVTWGQSLNDALLSQLFIKLKTIFNIEKHNL